jgi:hypothetical protein
MMTGSVQFINTRHACQTSKETDISLEVFEK